MPVEALEADGPDLVYGTTRRARAGSASDEFYGQLILARGSHFVNRVGSTLVVSNLLQAAWLPSANADTASGKAAYAGKKFALAETEFVDAADSDNAARFYLGRLFLLGRGGPAMPAIDAYRMKSSGLPQEPEIPT